MGARGELKELGRRLWADDCPRAGRRRAAVNYVLDSNGSPLSQGWDWAARSLEFGAPGPLRRAVSRGAPILIPTIAQDAASQKCHGKDTNSNMDTQDSQEAMKYPPISSDIIDGRTPLNLDAIIPQDRDHAQRVESRREPASAHLGGHGKTVTWSERLSQ